MFSMPLKTRIVVLVLYGRKKGGKRKRRGEMWLLWEKQGLKKHFLTPKKSNNYKTSMPPRRESSSELCSVAVTSVFTKVSMATGI